MQQRPRTIKIHTQGCRLNQSETATLAHMLEQGGFQMVDTGPADVAVINTCTVTENGDSDTRQLISRILREYPATRIALVGCQAQVYKAQLSDLPNVDWIVGTAAKFSLPEILDQPKSEGPQILVPESDSATFRQAPNPQDSTHTRANLKIQDGCDCFCAYCVVPYARGPVKSRAFDNLLEEARALVAHGHKELVLTGINVGRFRDGDQDVMAVIDALENLEGLARIRISSIEPTTIPEALIKRLAKAGKLCRFMHIPLQSGCDPVLEAMGRPYTTADFTQLVNRILSASSHTMIGVDVIVGFPGETEAYFDQTYDYLSQLPVHYFHVFSYSERPFTRARELPDKVASPEIIRRSQRLRALSQHKRRAFLDRMQGQVTTVLFEQKKRGFWTGLTDNYIRVLVQSDADLTNQCLPVRLNEIHGEAMRATVIK